MKEALRKLLKLQDDHQLHFEKVYGGDICESFSVTLDSGERYFVKTQDVSLISMFHAEQQGLLALSQCAELNIPHSLGVIHHGQTALLVLTHLELHQKSDAGLERLGRGLAQLHHIEHQHFGFEQDNFIGRTPQKNTWANNWTDFWNTCRLQPQIHLLKNKGAPKSFINTAQKFCERLPLLLGHQPRPSLLHGDLWSGNYGICADGTPSVFDPAVYFGDRETDLAMTRLFGGFSQRFYDAYQEIWPSEYGCQERSDIYNIYHLLNHANLFGGSYLAQAQSAMQRFI